MAITRNFKLFLNAGSQIPLLIHANQYDSGEQWRFTLYNQDGSVYEPSSGAIVGIKSDGHGIINTGTVSGGKVVITETQQMTAAAGKAVFELMIDGGSHGTANFIVLVEPKPGDQADLSESDLSLIQEAINSTTPANIANAVSNWMDDNLAPGEWVIDSLLSTSGAAADAKKTGDEISALKSAVSDISQPTVNLNTTGSGRYTANSNTGVIGPTTATRQFGMIDMIPCEASTQYTVSLHNVSYTKASMYAYYYDSNKTFISRSAINNQTGNSATFTTVENASYIYFNAYGSEGDITLNDGYGIQVEKGSQATDYVEPFTAVDIVARQKADSAYASLNGSVPVGLNSGYYNSPSIDTKGPASTDKYEKYTDKINAQLYKTIAWSLNFTSSVAGWMACSIWHTDGTYSRPTLVNGTGNSWSGEIAVTDDMKYIAFSFRSYNEDCLTLSGLANVSSAMAIADRENDIDSNILRSSIGVNSLRFKPFYDHLFIDKINGENVTIPSESLFNIQVSHRLGFDMIEANVHPTSDSNFIVMHGVSGKFGQQVQHVDGTTDISETAINSVTLAWIKSNVRYKSLYAKYRVAPPSLEEFLYECRRNCMIPMVTASNTDALAIIDQIMGKGNYVAYNGSREYTDAPILTYPSLTTKEEILALCESYGKPYMYCMANPTSFTDSQLTEIVSLLHENGYWIGFAGSYLAETETQRLMALGFDFCASKYQVNDFANGNLCNLSADIDYSDFSTNGTVANNLLTLATGNTIAPKTTLDSVFLGKGSLHIMFNGSVNVRLGKYINSTFTSDGSRSLWFSTYFLNESPTFLVTAAEATQIINIDYKASNVGNGAKIDSSLIEYINSLNANEVAY